MAIRSKPTPPTPSSTPVYKWLYIGVGKYGTKAHAVVDTHGTDLVGMCRAGGRVQTWQVAPPEDQCKRCLLEISRGASR